jgi:hypothetical protein
MAGTQYDITQFIDLQKMQAEFDKLDSRVQQSAKEMDKLIGKMGALGVGADYSKAATKVEEYRAKMELAEKNYQDSMSKIVEQANTKAQLAEQKHQEKLAQIHATNQAKLEQLKEQHANTMARISQLQADKLAAQQQAQSAKEAQQQKAAIDRRIAREQAALDKIEQARRRADAKAAFSYTPEQKASVSYDSSKQAQILKLNAILASEYSTALERLDAKMRLLEIDMQSKFNPALQEQSSEFRQLVTQHIGFIIPLIHFSCHGYTHPDRQAMSQGSSIHFNTRNSDSGVPRKNGTILPQCVQNAFSHEPSGFQRHIQSLHTMSLTQNETIPQIILRVTCIYIHHIKVKSSKNIEERQVSTDMSGFCFIDNFN